MNVLPPHLYDISCLDFENLWENSIIGCLKIQYGIGDEPDRNIDYLLRRVMDDQMKTVEEMAGWIFANWLVYQSNYRISQEEATDTGKKFREEKFTAYVQKITDSLNLDRDTVYNEATKTFAVGMDAEEAVGYLKNILQNT